MPADVPRGTRADIAWHNAVVASVAPPPIAAVVESTFELQLRGAPVLHAQLVALEVSVE